jgi:starch synthase (maltosyl-transferring)
VVLENLAPVVDGGRFPSKRSIGETIRIEIDAFVDGHDKVAVDLLHRRAGSTEWQRVEMAPTVNDRWVAELDVHTVGYHEITAEAWVDRFGTWRYDLGKRVKAGQDVAVDLEIGARLVDEAAAEHRELSRSLKGFAELLRSGDRGEATEVALGAGLAALMRQHAPRHFQASWPEPLRIWVDRAKARFSTWYELFPRSASPDPSRHGTLRDVEGRLDRIAEMGFDVLYLPPIHPIGRAYRKGRNNTTEAQEGDVGSPWAIGGAEGGHDAIHPQLGTIADFERLVTAAQERGLEIAMDLAFQCSPDHPYVKEHPEWFKHRPDGTIQYAENPPKKYQDIYPFDFECEAWQDLWNELLRVTLYWVEHGVRIFRVDNPHTKPFPFWEWLIAQVKERNPDVLFLAEAFTRPKVMYRLAKLGFTQSYTYFAWRTEPWAIKQYYEELTKQPVVDFFRPNAWPNTPDILNEYLQTDARAAYIVRAVLAATLCANYGIYGPAFELRDHRAVKSGSEEYLDSEKYQIRQWDWSRRDSLADLLARLNQIRRQNPALQHDRNLVFHRVDNDRIVCYSKQLGDSLVLCAVNTDPYHTQWGRITLDLPKLGITPDQHYQVHDLLTGLRYQWQGWHPVVGLDPGTLPAHVFAVRRRARSEHDFDYYL